MDFGPADFEVEWTTPKSQEAIRLIGHWDAASKYVVHFGRPRVLENLEDLEAFQVGGEHFHAMAADPLMVFRQFLTALESSTPAWHEGARIPDRQSEPEAWRARNLFDRTAIVRNAFESACSKVGLDLADG